MEKPQNITDNDWKLLQEIYSDRKEYLLEKLANNYPIQYLIGNVNFYGLEIKADERVFIPRFETEGLIAETIKYIKELDIIKPQILDICSGSGAIAITLAHLIPSAKVTAIELSKEAITLAKENAKNNNVKVKFKRKDFLKIRKLNNYDVIISNPPYVREDEEMDKENYYEPQTAFFAENNGLVFYEEIFKKCNEETKLIALEIGSLQGSNVLVMAKNYFPNKKIILKKDDAGKMRYVFIFC